VARRDFSEVAVRRGEPAPNAEEFAPFEMAINLISGLVILGVIVSVVTGAWTYSTWSAVAGSTIWCKFFASFALSRHAHAAWSKPKR
jgi:hypothetical protein